MFVPYFYNYDNDSSEFEDVSSNMRSELVNVENPNESFKESKVNY